MAGLLSFLRRRATPVRDFSALTRADRPLAIIGDLHGRLDLLTEMQALIAARDRRALVVVVGDMTDRGPDSAGVLRALHAQSTATPDDLVCLMGNHERMLLDFLADPARHGPRWLSHGGTETLASFGLSPWTQSSAADPKARLAAQAADLRRAMGPALLTWLETLPLYWHEGALAITHAGADPTRAVDAQDPDALLWGHRAFLRQPRRDGIWVAHGHTIMRSATAEAGRIAVDTGAWRTNRLSAAWIDQNGLSFVTVPGGSLPN